MENNAWDEAAEGWDDDDAVKAYSEAAFESLLALSKEHDFTLRDAHVLDFGCGTGTLTEHLQGAGARVFALDTSAAMLAKLRAKIRARGWQGVRTGSELPSETFDIVVCSSVCAFLPDYRGTLKELVAMMKPGGLFVQWDWELDPQDAQPYGLTRAEIGEALVAAGLENIVVDVAFKRTIGEHVMQPLIGSGRA